MNHRYSYCKRENNEHPEPTSTPTPPSHLDSDDRESDGEEEEDLSNLDMSDIRVVRVGEDYDDEEESGGEERQENTQEGPEEGEDIDIDIDIDTLEEEVWETMETEDGMETEESREESGYGEGDLNHEENAEMATEEEQNDWRSCHVVLVKDRVTYSASHTILGLPWKLSQLFTVYKTQVCLIHKQYFPCFKEIFSFNKEREKKVQHNQTSWEFEVCCLLGRVTESPRYVDLSVFIFSFS